MITLDIRSWTVKIIMITIDIRSNSGLVNLVNPNTPLDTYIFRNGFIVFLSASTVKVPTNTGRTTVIELDEAFIRRDRTMNQSTRFWRFWKAAKKRDRSVVVNRTANNAFSLTPGWSSRREQRLGRNGKVSSSFCDPTDTIISQLCGSLCENNGKLCPGGWGGFRVRGAISFCIGTYQLLFVKGVWIRPGAFVLLKLTQKKITCIEI